MNFVQRLFNANKRSAADVSEKGGVAYSGNDPTLAQHAPPEESPFPPRRALSDIAAPSFAVDHGIHHIYNKEEDRHDALVATIGGRVVHFLMVADGHGGAQAAQICSEKMLGRIVAEAKGDPSAASLGEAGKRAFASMHAEVCAAFPGGSENQTPGTTCTIVAICPSLEEVLVLNVGDSLGLFVPSSTRRRRQTHKMITTDHRLESSPDEVERVRGLGGQISRAMNKMGAPVGPIRLWPAGLTMGRAIGDSDAAPYIDATPSVNIYPLLEGDYVICSDGVWDSISPTRVASICAASKKPKSKAEHIVQTSFEARYTTQMVNLIYEHRNPVDDITTLVFRCRASSST